MAISIQQAMAIINDKYVIESNAIPIVSTLHAEIRLVELFINSLMEIVS